MCLCICTDSHHIEMKRSSHHIEMKREATNTAGVQVSIQDKENTRVLPKTVPIPSVRSDNPDNEKEKVSGGVASPSTQATVNESMETREKDLQHRTDIAVNVLTSITG